MGPRWRKVWADVGSNKLRSLLVVLSIAVGTFAVGVVAGFGIVVERAMTADFRSANPHAAVITCEPFDDGLLQAVRRLPDVAGAEGRTVLAARISGPSGDWLPVQIVAIPPLDEMTIDRLRPVGVCDLSSPGEREVLIERTGLGPLAVQPGDAVRIELPDGQVRELRVAAAVHDVTRVSVPISGRVTLYVAPAAMAWLGESQDYDHMVIVAAGRSYDETHVRRVARAVADRVEDSGRRVSEVSLYRPGEPPMGFVLRALLVVEGSMVAFLVLLSTLLVVNTITTLLGQHVRQIGVMKAVGARTPQILGMYVALVLSFGVLALAIAVPPAVVAVAVSLGVAGEMMNFEPGRFSMPAGALLVQIWAALGVPVLAALIPTISGTRITIRQAIRSYGLGVGKTRRGWVDRLLARLRLLSRPTLLALRNTFRRRGRLALTLCALALGGALFVAVFNLRASFARTLEGTRGYTLADVNVALARPYRTRRVEQVLDAVPGVARVEGWGLVPAQVLSADRLTGIGIVINAPPGGSTLIRPVIVAGRWLRHEDQNAIVICNQLTRRRPDVGVGDELVVDIRGQETLWRVVGVCQMPGDVEPGVAYANYSYLAEVVGEVGRAADYHIVTSVDAVETRAQVAQTLEERFKQMGIPVASITTSDALRAQQAFGVDIFVNFLLVLSGLVALVGGLGLMVTMSMGVLERVREIGVMRAIGASDGAIAQLVLAEGLVIGALSWLLGTVLAVPVSGLLADGVGIAFLDMPLTLVISPGGFLAWLVVTMALSALASLVPARSASRLTIRDVLAYE